MPKRQYRLPVFIVSAALGLVYPVSASQFVIDVQNAGFEDSTVFSQAYGAQQWNSSAPGWTVIGASDSAGDYRPVEERYSTYSLFINPFEGLNVGYSNTGTLSQVLAAQARMGVTYTMSVAVGRRGDLPGQSYTIGLYSAGIPIGVYTGNTGTMMPASWNVIDFSVRNTVVNNQPLEIRLTAGGIQVNFDTIRLFADTPEPQTFFMGPAGLLILGTIAVRRHRAKKLF